MRIMPQEQLIENGRWRRLHPWPVRVMHWSNALAIVMMIGSGWRIYNNDPIFPAIYFPTALTLGGNEELTYKLHGDAGFGNALLWHFAFMWLLVINGLAYVTHGPVTGRFRRMLLPLLPRELLATIDTALHFKLSHDDLMYNAVQKTMYVGVIAALAVIGSTTNLPASEPRQMRLSSWQLALIENDSDDGATRPKTGTVCGSPVPIPATV